MKSAARTFYWQIAGLYLALIVVFSVAAIVLVGRQFEGFLGEVEQRLNLQLAGHLAQELAAVIASETHEGEQDAIQRINGINPSIEIYELASDGTVVHSFTGKPAIRNHVDIAPIRQFVAKDVILPIRAIDPGTKQGEKVFSASALPSAVGGGYLYVILPGMPFESMAHMVRSSYILRGMAGVLAAVLVSTAIAGLVLLSLVTRRFRKLSVIVKRFQEGAFDERADVEPNDQIGRLGATFNVMAATIAEQFEALRRTDDARRAFASNISHDFRTPLTALRGYTDRLLRAEDRLGPEERRHHLNAVMKSSAQLEHLANQLALIVQLDSGGDYILKRETFSIAELVQDAVMQFTPRAEERGIYLMLLDPQDVPPVCGDIAFIERALANLIDNALNNTARGGTIEINLPVTEGRVMVCVKDTGRGIQSDEVPLLTQRFYRTSHSRHSGAHGTGLGLSIVEDIVKKHGGKLFIESRVGDGTVFSFTLPTSVIDQPGGTPM